MMPAVVPTAYAAFTSQSRGLLCVQLESAWSLRMGTCFVHALYRTCSGKGGEVSAARGEIQNPMASACTVRSKTNQE